MKTSLKKAAYFLLYKLKVAYIYSYKAFLNLYHFLKIQSFIHFFKFLFHRYATDQFVVTNMKHNIGELIQLKKGDWLDSNRKGGIKRIPSRSGKFFFALKNLLSLGAFQSRIERVVYYTFIVFSIEVYNPFTKEILETYLERKLRFAKRLLEKLDTINHSPWNRKGVLEHLDIFLRGSLLQGRVIDWIHKAVKKQPAPVVVRDVQAALKKGLFPLLITTGCSGAYWMRGTDRSVAGLFKPFDEEIHAPNNPIGPSMQGALGQKKTRWGIRVGEAAHREVAAFLVDQFFGFGIVPKTYYASFTHPIFYSALEDRFATKRPKTKMGSFQEFIEGFSPLYKLEEPLWHKIPLEAYQLLLILDLITGNTDRNTGNILIGEDSIAAIDHGLIFSSVSEKITTWYWEMLEQGKEPIFPSFMELLQNFPYEKLAWKLHKNCFIEWPCLARMRERVMLFKEGAKAGYTPKDLSKLMTEENLLQLIDLSDSLELNAKQIVNNFNPALE